MRAEKMGQKERVLFLPDWREGNPYQSLLAAAVRKCGYRVDFDELRSIPFVLQVLRRSHPKAKVIHIHWIDDLIASLLWSTTPLKRAVRLWLLGLDILMLRFRGIRVVWTVHNLVSHESRDPDFEKRIRRTIARTANQLIFHSERARAMVEEAYGIRLCEKSAVIPHGNYAGFYATDPERVQQLRRELGLSIDDFVLLFFGAV
ncbi:MAG: glycosyltransferase, partial [Woeseiaceae bacterium]|nr:glycosyltransferase [Woeseiaceae bacterium]